MELSSFFNIRDTSFIVDSFVDVMNVVKHCSHSIKPFFCSRRAEFVLISEVCGAWIEAIETSISGVFIHASCCGAVRKFQEGQQSTLVVLPIMIVLAEVRLQCLDYSFTKSVGLWVVGSREPQVDVELSVQLLVQLWCKLCTTIQGDRSR